MAKFRVSIQHDEKTLEALARKQYDLFSVGNLAARSIISLAAVLYGVYNFSSWWGVLLVAYGSYLMTSTYSSARRSAHKTAEAIRAAGLPFPGSVYSFNDRSMNIEALNSAGKREDGGSGEKKDYSDIIKLGEDREYYYLFPNRFGGYMVSKEQLGERCREFREFIEKRTGLRFVRRTAPFAALLEWMRSIIKPVRR